MILGGPGSKRLDNRRRGRLRGGALRALIYVTVGGIVSYWAYGMGSDRAASRSEMLKDRITMLEAENTRLQALADDAETTRTAVEQQLAETIRRYRDEAPQGVEQEIMQAVRLRIADGVPPDQISYVIGAASSGPRCGEEVVTRRFLLQTPLSRGAHASVSFAGNAITVTGAGASAIDAGGAREAWFDAAAPVSIVFTRPGGVQSESEGVLPLYHAVVIGPKSHNFTISAAETRGFVNVTEQVCDYP